MREERKVVRANKVNLLCAPHSNKMVRTGKVDRGMPSNSEYRCHEGCSVWSPNKYPRYEEIAAPEDATVLTTSHLAFVLTLFAGTEFEGCVNIDNEGELWLRFDIDDCGPKDQWSEYVDLQERLRSMGLELYDPQTEHDCISGGLQFITA